MASHARDRVSSLVATSARAAVMYAAFCGLVLLPPVIVVLVVTRGATLASVPRVLGSPVLALSAGAALFGVLWFSAYGVVWLLDRRSTLLEPECARPTFEEGEVLVREGLGTLQGPNGAAFGKLYLTSRRLRFRAFRIARRPVDESIPLERVRSVYVYRRRFFGVPTGRLVIELGDGEGRAFYGYDEAGWRDAVKRTTETVRG